MRSPPPALDTPRLRLRLPRIEDADAMFAAYTTDPEVCRYMSWRPHASIEDTRAFVAAAIDGWQTGVGERLWVIERRDDARLLGTIGARAFHGTCLGYVLAREHWGRGYMTEAVRVVIAAALAESYRVWAFCDVDNVPSARVMEKAGMSFEGILRRFAPHANVQATPRDCKVYATVR